MDCENNHNLATAENNLYNRFNDKMTVKEILRSITVEEAKQVVADTGFLKGESLQYIMLHHPLSLKWYISKDCKSSRHIKAAAKKLLENEKMKVAS